MKPNEIIKEKNDCDLCCLSSSVYCMECFRSGCTCSEKDNWRPKTKKNILIIKQLKQEVEDVE